MMCDVFGACMPSHVLGTLFFLGSAIAIAAVGIGYGIYIARRP